MPVDDALALGLFVSIPTWLCGYLWASRTMASIAGRPGSPAQYLSVAMSLLGFVVVGGVASMVLTARWSPSPWWLRVWPGLAAGAMGATCFMGGALPLGIPGLPAVLVSILSINYFFPFSLFPPLFLFMMELSGAAVARTLLEPVATQAAVNPTDGDASSLTNA